MVTHRVYGNTFDTNNVHEKKPYADTVREIGVTNLTDAQIAILFRMTGHAAAAQGQYAQKQLMSLGANAGNAEIAFNAQNAYNFLKRKLEIEQAKRYREGKNDISVTRKPLHILVKEINFGNLDDKQVYVIGRMARHAAVGQEIFARRQLNQVRQYADTAYQNAEMYHWIEQKLLVEQAHRRGQNVDYDYSQTEQEQLNAEADAQT